MSNKIVILGTDTDVGKTSFALLWMARFGGEFDYWKPFETGDSDTRTLQTLVPYACCHPPICRFDKPVAPSLAAKLQGKQMPKAAVVARQCPDLSLHQRGLMIETFGSPFSPLNEHELQIALVERLTSPTILISSSALGAIGRTMACLIALKHLAHTPAAVVLMGKADSFAVDEIEKHGEIPTFSLGFPEQWTVEGIAQCSRQQVSQMEKLRELLGNR